MADVSPLEPPPGIEVTMLEPGAARPGAPPAGKVPAEAPGPTVVLTIPRLVVIVEGKPGREHVLKPGITTLGRSPKTDIQVLFSEVSRTHAEVVWEADGFAILDLDSENGVFVNGEKVKKQALKDGDTIQIGPQKFVFRT
jgi:pSer/pThr/pTyr-binding forkhead associated (FHA) protein